MNRSSTDRALGTTRLASRSRNEKEKPMSAHDVRSDLNIESVEAWLVESLARRLERPASEIDVDQYFDEFDLDPSEAPIPTNKLKGWLGFELGAAALWHHPTVASLAQHIVGEIAKRAMPEATHSLGARAA
jgi:hypothetical protein